MREALRSSKRRYQIDWEGRQGFIWTSILGSAPIVLAACPAADEIFTLYENRVTRTAYDLFRVPIPFFRGFGLSPLPRPVRLRHLISEPIAPPCRPEEATPEIVARHHKTISIRMQSLIAVAKRL